VGFEAR